MRTSHSVKWILAGALIMPGLTGCSFFGGGDEAEVASSEETAAAEGAEGANAQAEASDNAEAIGAENSTINDAAVASAAEAAAGPAGGGLPGSEIPPELLANGGTPSATDPSAGATAMGGGGAGGGGGFAAPPSDVRVYYVSSSSANLHQSPNATSQAVGAVKKGDPVLVKVEGNWANVINRGWVELASLSMSPVARPKPAKAWN